MKFVCYSWKKKKKSAFFFFIFFFKLQIFWKVAMIWKFDLGVFAKISEESYLAELPLLQLFP